MSQQHNSEFNIPGHVQLNEGENRFPNVVLTNKHGAAEVYLHGAQVTEFRLNAHAEPILWMSPEAVFAEATAIRGGVPICWPWFGPHPTDDTQSMHGFARTSDWTVLETAVDDDRVNVTFALHSDESTLAVWPHEFELRFTVSLSDRLSMRLDVQNKSADPVTMSGALHTYFNVSQIQNATIDLGGPAEYLDKVDDMSRKTGSEPVVFDQEVDRIYFPPGNNAKVRDTGFDRTINVTSEGSRSTVVWNPWIDKSRSLGNFPDDGYKTMLCVEAANAADDVRTLQPGEKHTLGQTISLS